MLLSLQNERFPGFRWTSKTGPPGLGGLQSGLVRCCVDFLYLLLNNLDGGLFGGVTVVLVFAGQEECACFFKGGVERKGVIIDQSSQRGSNERPQPVNLKQIKMW